MGFFGSLSNGLFNNPSARLPESERRANVATREIGIKQRQAEKRKAFVKEQTKLGKLEGRRLAKERKREFSVKGQLKSIQRVQQQEAQFAQPQPEFTTAQQVRQSRQPQGITNFFEHRSTGEVFGDEGLTLFDSNKPNRTQRRTGQFFGI